MFSCPEFPWQLYIGKQVPCVPNLQAALQETTDQDFDFLETPLFHPRFSQAPGVERALPPTRSAYALESNLWSRFVIGRLSDPSGADSKNPALREKVEKQLVMQFTWAMHIGVYGIVLPLPTMPGANLVRIINRFLAEGLNQQQLIIEVTLNQWDHWNYFRSHMGPSTCVGISLVLTKNLPEPEILKRWLGEPVSYLVFKIGAFSINAQGYPVLPEQLIIRPHRLFIQKFFRQKVGTIVGPGKDAAQIRAYICFLFRSQVPFSWQEQNEHSY